jgi:hypothetical protein
MSLSFESWLLGSAISKTTSQVNAICPSPEMENARWCLYLPGLCMHAVPACRRPGSGDLHLEIDHFPTTLKYRPIPTIESVGPHCAEVPFNKSSLADLLKSHGTAESSSSGSISTAEVLFCEELMELTNHEKAFENTSTSVAASQMRNALTALADTCKDPHQKEVSLLYGAAEASGS